MQPSQVFPDEKLIIGSGITGRGATEQIRLPSLGFLNGDTPPMALTVLA
jgi:hypothetical protein